MIQYQEIACGECGVEFHVPIHFYKERQTTGAKWYCPNGHCRMFSETTADKLRRERDRLQQQLAEKDDTIRAKEREVTAIKGQLTRAKKCSAAGTCPCCTRTFSNMTVHMKKMHPEFVSEHASKPNLRVVKSQ